MNELNLKVSDQVKFNTSTQNQLRKYALRCLITFNDPIDEEESKKRQDVTYFFMYTKMVNHIYAVKEVEENYVVIENPYNESGSNRVHKSHLEIVNA